MRLEFHFNHMGRSEALETFVSERLEPVVEDVLHRDDCHVLVWLMTIHSRVQRGTPEFRAEIEIRYPPRKDFFVAKNADDIHVAVIDAIDALREHIREDGKHEIEMRNTAQSAAEAGLIADQRAREV
jgi:ribosome-associated translation inhibitor RaiA